MQTNDFVSTAKKLDIPQVWRYTPNDIPIIHSNLFWTCFEFCMHDDSNQPFPDDSLMPCQDPSTKVTPDAKISRSTTTSSISLHRLWLCPKAFYPIWKLQDFAIYLWRSSYIPNSVSTIIALWKRQDQLLNPLWRRRRTVHIMLYYWMYIIFNLHVTLCVCAGSPWDYAQSWPGKCTWVFIFDCVFF